MSDTLIARWQEQVDTWMARRDKKLTPSAGDSERDAVRKAKAHHDLSLLIQMKQIDLSELRENTTL